jgi:hypothetical protein
VAQDERNTDPNSISIHENPKTPETNRTGLNSFGPFEIKVTQQHYDPWVRDRQLQLEADLQRAWHRDPIVLLNSNAGNTEVSRRWDWLASRKFHEWEKKVRREMGKKDSCGLRYPIIANNRWDKIQRVCAILRNALPRR